MFVKSLLAIVLLTVFSVLPLRALQACSLLPPSSYVAFTDDMKHVLMLHDGPDALSQKYKRSGLYRMDGSVEPAWEVDWYSRRAFPHSGGRYLVKVGYGVSFYDEGKLLHQYSAEDLFEDTNNIEEDPCFGRLWRTDDVLDESSDVFKLATAEHTAFTFSLATGEILKAEEYVKSEFEAVRKQNQNARLSKRANGLSKQATQALLAIIAADWRTVEEIGRPYYGDYSLAKKIIGTHGKTFYKFDDSIQSDKEMAILAVTSGDASDPERLVDYRDDPEVIAAAQKYNESKNAE